MTSFLTMNQGYFSNNYTSTASSIGSSIGSSSKKIENSYHGLDDSADMSSLTEHKNMYSDYEEYDSGDESPTNDFSDYSDAESSDTGDRLEDDERTRRQIIEDQISEDERNTLQLQHPDDMKYIRPARTDIPSKAKQDAWLQSVLDEELYTARKAWAAPIIETWWKNCLIKKAAKKTADRIRRRHAELGKWKQMYHPTNSISQLSSQKLFNEEYDHMVRLKKQYCGIKAGLDEHFHAIKVKADRLVAEKKAAKAFQKAGKARALAKRGMNKKTEWHTARAAGSLHIKPKTTICSPEGQGKRTTRRLRRAKEKQEAEDYARLLGPIAEKPKIPDIEIESETKTDEELAAEQAEMAEAMARINRRCVEISEAREKQEAEEKQAIEDEKKRLADEKAAEDEFVTVMASNALKSKPNSTKSFKPTKSSKPTVQLGFKGLKEQAIERRKKTDANYNERCDAFEVLANKDKLAENLKFTSLCKSVTTGKKCYHKDCRFAHKIEDLLQRDCRFGLGCKFVRKLPSGQFKNVKFGRTGKICSCMHPGEHKRGFCARMGMKYTESTIPVTAPVPVTTPAASTTSTKTTSLPTSVSAPTTGAWAKVVTKAEAAQKLAECKAKMTKPWATVVVATLTPEEKREIYGRGVDLLGEVDEKTESPPVIPTTARKPWDTRGLGFSEQDTDLDQDREQVRSTTTLVTTPGFNWVAGAVLAPETIDPMVQVMAAVRQINQRIAMETEIMKKVNLAKAKALEINRILAKRSRRREERKKRRQKTEKSKSVNHLPITIFRVPRADAKLAVLNALRSGVTNTRIECFDDSSDECRSSDECDCGDCPDCGGVQRPHMIDLWGYKRAMIPSKFH